MLEAGFEMHTVRGIDYIPPPALLHPGWPLLMGSDPALDQDADADEQPQHGVELETYSDREIFGHSGRLRVFRRCRAPSTRHK